MRTIIWRLIYIAVAVGIAAAIFVGIPSRPKMGAPCGPHHYWQYVGSDPAEQPDLSCEPDKR